MKDQVIGQRGIFTVCLRNVEERGRTLEALLEALRAKEERLGRENDKVVYNLRGFKIHAEIT